MTEQPTADEITRVAAYWHRVTALGCEHPEVTFDTDGMTCTECRRPLRCMSDIQIEEIRNG